MAKIRNSIDIFGPFLFQFFQLRNCDVDQKVKSTELVIIDNAVGVVGDALINVSVGVVAIIGVASIRTEGVYIDPKILYDPL